MSDIHSDSYEFISPTKLHGLLQAHVVLVTGAGRGIGRSIAFAFAKAGASVACISRTSSEIEAVAAEIESACGVPVLAITADVSEPATPLRIVAEVEQKLGPIDVLINNAAISKINTLEHEKDFDSWWHVVEVNLRGPAALTHAVLPGMLKRGRGNIISLASRCGSGNIPYTSAYSASKAALIRFHHVLAIEIGPRPVYTYVVQPGDVPTSLSKSPGVIDLETLRRVPNMRKMLQATAGQCTETPELTADTLVMLVANDKAKVLSGKCINAQQDMGQVLDEAMKLETGRIERDSLYVLKVEEL
ncbi:hypothetical protein F4677DRAFT_454368 [Hypoxylon crocopeplum]|nr:hypothetical protein F4677DRAFT_454368 [Hypoxylon crocopeplum]